MFECCSNIVIGESEKAALQLESASQVIRGGNNCIRKILSGNNESFAAKEYSSRGSEKNERLNREFKALTFLNQHGIDCVPVAISCDLEKNSGVYQWVDGKKVEDISKHDIDCATHFLKKLKQLAVGAGANQLIIAKDACINSSDLFKLVEMRFKRLEMVSSEYPEVKNFVSNQCWPTYERLRKQLCSIYNDASIKVGETLSQKHQTLSPSDYGFHNALRTKEGQLYFIDFEYFGWDDPVKMVSDFLWHPGMVLSDDQKKYFQGEMSVVFADDENYEMRFKAQYPLYGLIWVLILLNNFIPNFYANKKAMGIVKEDEIDIILKQQLIRARQYFSNIERGLQ